jgi:hypothetical protein
VNRQIQLAGARVTRFEPVESRSLATLRLVSANLAATGSYSEIMGMLSRLESLPENLRLEHVELRSGQDGANVACAAKMVILAKNSETSD